MMKLFGWYITRERPVDTWLREMLSRGEISPNTARLMRNEIVAAEALHPTLPLAPVPNEWGEFVVHFGGASPPREYRQKVRDRILSAFPGAEVKILAGMPSTPEGESK